MTRRILPTLSAILLASVVSTNQAEAGHSCLSYSYSVPVVSYYTPVYSAPVVYSPPLVDRSPVVYMPHTVVVPTTSIYYSSPLISHYHYHRPFVSRSGFYFSRYHGFGYGHSHIHMGDFRPWTLTISSSSLYGLC